MRKTAKTIITVSAIAALMSGMTLTAQVQAAEGKAATPAQMGKKVAENRKTGNCVACHSYQGAVSPGNIAPPFVAMKARFPDKARLRDQIWDATKYNPDSLMPPFGRHKIIKEAEIDNLVEWLYTL